VTVHEVVEDAEYALEGAPLGLFFRQHVFVSLCVCVCVCMCVRARGYVCMCVCVTLHTHIHTYLRTSHIQQKVPVRRPAGV
jgi:hypothetical protein